MNGKSLAHGMVVVPVLTAWAGRMHPANGRHLADERHLLSQHSPMTFDWAPTLFKNPA